MEEQSDREVTVVERSPLAGLVAAARAEEWLLRHLPSAERWWRLWLADREALRIAIDIADALPGSRGVSLLADHEAAERASSLGYLSELLTAERHAMDALDAHDVRPDTARRLQARRARIAELILEVQRATEPKS